MAHRDTVLLKDPPGGFGAATRAQPAQAVPMAAKAPLASSNDPDGLLRLERSRAQTSKGLKRLANAIIRDAIGIPLTRTHRAEIRAQGPKLDPRDIDKNIYRTPPFRQRSPKDMQNRRKPGWTDCQFVLPRVTLEGLSHLAKTMADQERWERSRAPRGFRRRYPKTKNYFVVKALNYLLEENGLSQFCVEETEATPGRVCRFVAPGD